MPASTNESAPRVIVDVPPNAVRVWRGFRLASVPRDKFLVDLGTIFVPVTVQMQRLFHLSAYLPAIVPSSRPDGVPDEIALVFYRTQQNYKDASLCVGGRAYSLLHSAVFDLGPGGSLSDFPDPLPGVLAFDKPYFLFDDAADWQSGLAQVFVGSRPNATDPDLLAYMVRNFAQELRADRPSGLDGAVIVASANYAIYWEHWLSPEAAQSSRIGHLATIATTVLSAPYKPVAVPIGLDARWLGLSVSGGDCLNTQFARLPATQ